MQAINYHHAAFKNRDFFPNSCHHAFKSKVGVSRKQASTAEIDDGAKICPCFTLQSVQMAALCHYKAINTCLCANTSKSPEAKHDERHTNHTHAVLFFVGHCQVLKSPFPFYSTSFLKGSSQFREHRICVVWKGGKRQQAGRMMTTNNHPSTLCFLCACLFPVLLLSTTKSVR